MLIAARDENERLIAIIKVLQRDRFGPRSEKIDPDQLALMLEDVEQAVAAGEAEAEAEGKRESAGTTVRRKRQINRGALPKHLPREEVVVDLADRVGSRPKRSGQCQSIFLPHLDGFKLEPATV